MPQPPRSEPPRFSIVTPCLNRAATIEAAIRSVVDQAHPSVEHIIIDGGSTDGTLAILARYPHLRVISGPDRNLYDAINKGIRLARGDWVGLLNSDDLYTPNAFAIAEAALAEPGIEMVIGGADIFREEAGAEVLLGRFQGEAATGLSEANAMSNMTVVNACFFARALLDRVGLFDDRFPLVADRDVWMRLVLARPRHRVLPAILYRYRSHAGSLTFAATDLRDRLSHHLLLLAAAKLEETRAVPRDHAAYRRWHAWAAGYRCLQQIRLRQLRAAGGTAWQAFGRDGAWPFRFAIRLLQHYRQRDIRRGHPTGPD